MWGREARIKKKPEVFCLERQYAEEMIAHAREQAPNECCGVLAGSEGTVTNLYRMTNTERSPFRYKVDSRELFHLIKEVEEKGWEILGIYHSHTHTLAHPSPLDVELAFWPEALQFIISLSQSSQPVIRAFKIIDREVKEERVIKVVKNKGK